MKIKTITITRFSYDGFYPQCQKKYLEENSIEKDDEFNPNFHKGVWAFIQGKEDRFLLNHRNDIPDITCWKAEIPLDTIVFKHDDPTSIHSVSTAEKEMDEGAFFIPEYSLKELSNIKQTYNIFSD